MSQTASVRRGFFLLRLARFYPIYATGLSIALFAGLFASAQHTPDSLSRTQTLLAFVCEALFLPSPFTGASGRLFPLNPVSWSLFLELAVNGLFGLWMFRASKRLLIALVAVSATLICWFSFARNGLESGFNWATLHIGILRTLCSFAIGVALARRRRAPATLPAALLVAALALLLWLDPGPLRGLYDVLFILLASPALVVFGSAASSPAWAGRLLARLGEISFPLYGIHYPLILAAAWVAKRLHTPPVPSGVAVVGLLVVISWVLFQVDRRLRIRLSHWVRHIGLSAADIPPALK